MSFMDKIGAHLTNAGKTLSQTTRNFTDSNALQKEMSAEKRSIQQKYAEIGQLYYEKYKDDPSADFFAEVESITNSTKRIEELQIEIQDVQARKPELVPIPEDAPKSVQPSAMVCMQCGSTFDATQTFCSSCGQKLTAQYPTPAAAAAAPAQTENDVQTIPAPAPSLTQPADIILPKQVTETFEEVPKAPEADSAPEADPAPEASYGANFCTNCGAPAAADSAFCAQCGTKLK